LGSKIDFGARFLGFAKTAQNGSNQRFSGIPGLAGIFCGSEPPKKACPYRPLMAGSRGEMPTGGPGGFFRGPRFQKLSTPCCTSFFSKKKKCSKSRHSRDQMSPPEDEMSPFHEIDFFLSIFQKSLKTATGPVDPPKNASGPGTWGQKRSFLALFPFLVIL
jgi:hypothetical protein